MTNQDQTVSKVCFENLDELKTPYCQAMLRQAVVNYAYDCEASGVWSFIAQGSQLLNKGRWLTSGIGISLASLLILAIVMGLPGAGSGATPAQVQAQEIVGNMRQQVTLLPEQQRDRLEKLISADLDGCIREAMKARDLQVMDTSEMPVAYQNGTMGTGNSQVVLANVDSANLGLGQDLNQFWNNETENNRLLPMNLRYIAHTDSNGMMVIIGVDRSNLPVVRLVVVKNAENEATRMIQRIRE